MKIANFIDILFSRINYIITYGFILILFLYLQLPYVVFHSFTEIYSIIIAFSIFLISRHIEIHDVKDKLLVLLGKSFFYVGILDLFHTFAYQGINISGYSNPNLSTQIWIATRYFQSISILIIFLTINNNIHSKLYDILFQVSFISLIS
ncbi:MAG: hypothetical protein OEY49_11675, partial [Candidatus Heimdallarchaeota archaeon]|nr:hypothetical protein [Candidatus Heimdallarchaeota archaeon]